ncbi:MAG: hypothetical protein AAF197_09240 [Pseudomonadota bacterium]
MSAEALNLLTLCIAVFSLIVSCTMAGWTIYRDAIQKPKFRMSIAITVLLGDGERVGEEMITVTALNLGPGSNRVGSLIGRRSRWDRWIRRDLGQWFLNYDLDHFLSVKPNSRLEIGDKATFVIPFTEVGFLGFAQLHQVGMVDGFGRNHWIPQKQLERAREQYDEKFGRQSSTLSKEDE